MITRIFLTGLAATVLALGYSGDSFSQKFEAMPKAVQETAYANMENALPMSISSTKGENGTVYQINTRRGGETHNIVIDEKGKLLAVKDGTDLGSVPAAVKVAIEKEAASAKVVTVEKVTEGSLISYGAVVKDGAADGKYLNVRVAADGTVQSKTQQTTEK